MKNYAEKTVKAYIYWITSFIYFTKKSTHWMPRSGC
ncbi:hypothetical protein OW492_16685 [Psychromonas sp. 14N.309.X.WAT.B.A12]|nr:phage integrase N-terminal SAM-like domain-containing protein [Psychromonas sp. 14N.309.X.WAT.B.A12]MDN2665006.1 hypothetical protein [Psychromonas sp. 14N.309.X.WAT.B.A12]